MTERVLGDGRNIIVAICNVCGILFGSDRALGGQKASNSRLHMKSSSSWAQPNQSKPSWRKCEERPRWLFSIDGVVYC